jgi:hypothetical protein
MVMQCQFLRHKSSGENRYLKIAYRNEMVLYKENLMVVLETKKKQGP